MKKNKMMRIASLMLVLVMITCSAVGGTFAKYVTSGSASDEARVAKFGVKITANGNMFAKTYDGNGDTSVTSAGEYKVVAPGTSGDLVESTITGTPEVAVEVKREATLTLSGWTAKQASTDSAATYYCPIKITVGNTSYYGLDYESADAFITAVQNAIKADVKKYAPNTDLSGITADTLNVTWEWAFEGANGSKVNRTDYADTYLGDQAADGNAATIKLEVTTTVTQLDTYTAPANS